MISVDVLLGLCAESGMPFNQLFIRQRTISEIESIHRKLIRVLNIEFIKYENDRKPIIKKYLDVKSNQNKIFGGCTKKVNKSKSSVYFFFIFALFNNTRIIFMPLVIKLPFHLTTALQSNDTDISIPLLLNNARTFAMAMMSMGCAFSHIIKSI